jgi:hypothetical protein
VTEECEVRGHRDGVAEHATESGSLGRWVAMFRVVSADINAIISIINYQNGTRI